jgi:hypothetical protein
VNELSILEGETLGVDIQLFFPLSSIDQKGRRKKL